jgi:biotin/methionine sulfoxide reductase
MAIALAAMLGQIGRAGCGFSIGFGAVNGSAIVVPRDIPKPTLPIGHNPVSDAIPVALTGDLLGHPGKTVEFNGQTIEYPDIRLIYSAGGNPFHHNADLNTFLKAWQRPDTIIVHDHWWTPAARHADIILPVVTTLERNDILAADGQRMFVAMKQVMAPVAAARTDYEVFSHLADRLQFGNSFTEGRTEADWLRHMYDEAADAARGQGYLLPSFDEFWESGIAEFPEANTPDPLLADFIADPLGHPLATPSGRIELHSERIAGFGYDECPPHPAWIDPAEWLGSALTTRFPLHLLSNQPSARLHSQLDPAPASAATKIDGREPIRMHPADAAERGIGSGDPVRVFNDRGSFAAAAVPDESLVPGVVQVATGAWYDPAEAGTIGALDRHGNPNVVTSSTGSSRLSQASSVQTVLVEIEPFPDAPQPHPFEPPAMEPADENFLARLHRRMLPRDGRPGS